MSTLSRRCADQGIINTLLYQRRLWGEKWAVLHPRYNAVARLLHHSERTWGLPGAVVHWTGLSGRPWLKPKDSKSEWHRGCG